MDITLPKCFALSYFDEYLQITRMWRNAKEIIAVIIGALLFNGIWITNDFSEILFSDKALLLKLFCLLFIVLGFVSIYRFFTIFFNRTQIYVSQNAIEIKHQPIPWPGGKRVETKHIKQLLVETITRRSTSGDSPNYTYNVLGLTLEGKHVKLITGLSRHEYAHFIEKKIEDYLGIQNNEAFDLSLGRSR